ncbi:MAG TPA: ABC transporter substrate-binding protein [Acidimicrobiia bacterium]|nr:ABC transporter substrate-binding protein [Acidimicrobiia bacterium]
MRNRTWLLVVVSLALIVAACGGGGAGTTTAAPTATTQGEAPATTAGSAETTTSAAPVAETPYEHLNQAYAGEFAGTTVEIAAQWQDAEADNFNASLQPFRDATGIDVVFEPTPEYETVLQARVDGGDAPDLAQIAQPGKMVQYAEAGQLINLSDWFNVDQLSNDQVGGFVELGSHNGDLYGVFFKTDVKSIVWYPVQGFADAGYAVPTTWDELLALSDQIVADGTSPWCISIESQAADGWVATDWMEDILLRTAPPEIYRQWYAHEIPFNHPEVLEAAEVMRQIWFTPGYAYGGSTYINNTFIGDTQDPMFDPAGPQCWMQKQAAWIPGFWGANKDAASPDEWPNVPGEDVSFFYLPPIEEEFGNPVLGAGDMFVMFADRPEVRALLEYLATPEAARGWIERGGFVSPNKTVPVEWYSGYPNPELAALIADATTFGFDASDLMPAEVGAGTFWEGMVEWVAADGEGTETIFEEIESSWPAS